MNVIDSYLDTLFSPYPDSPRMQEAKSELRAMMEDKQHALLEDGHSESQAVGKVIAEFGSLEEVAPVLGISKELGGDPFAAEDLDRPPRLETDRLDEYAERVRRTQWMTAVAVPLFVLSPVPLLVLIAATSTNGPEPANWAVATGLVVLLLTVTTGVLTLVGRGSQLEDFEDIEEGRFTLSGPVRDYATQLRRENRRRYGRATAVAIALWILCATPVLITAFIDEGRPGEDGMLPLYGVSLTLLLVAVGLFLQLGASWSEHIASTLLQEDEQDEDDPENSSSPVVRVIAAVYWPVAAAIYLGWSFGTGEWGTTWIIWPVAGVLYAAVWGLSSALPSNSGDRGRAGAR